MPIYKNPLGLSDELLRDARANTLNQRINNKGNYELAITGGSHALDNQAFKDSNDYVAYMYVDPAGAWSKNEELQELNDRYTNPIHNRQAGTQPYSENPRLKYIHSQTPSTRRGRRMNDIFFNKARKKPYWDEEDEETIKKINEYEGLEK